MDFELFSARRQRRFADSLSLFDCNIVEISKILYNDFILAKNINAKSVYKFHK
jgi:hypothetical protein